MSAVNAKDLTPAQRRKMGIRLPRKSTFSKDDVRHYAIRALAPLAELTKSERSRVLRHAHQMNQL